MKKYYFLALTFVMLFNTAAQTSPKALKVTYTRSSNGKLIEGQEPIIAIACLGKSMITTQQLLSGIAEIPNEQFFIDLDKNRHIQQAQLKNDQWTVMVDSISLPTQKFEYLAETKKILGYTCKKAKTVVNSNTIELWYTVELGLKASPSILGQNLGLVLQTIRNGNFVVTATKVERLEQIPDALIRIPKGMAVDALTYRDLLWKSRFTNIEVFRKEIVNFSGEAKSSDSILRFASGTVIVRKIKFPEIKNGSQVFVDVTEQSNGDAYDRTGSVFLIPTALGFSFLDGFKNGIGQLPIYENGNGKKYQGTAATDDFSPLLELMRFFTPFGVGQYNSIQLKGKTWQDSVFYRQDISDLRTAFSGKEVYIGINIGNYDKGGHRVSVNISIHSEGESQKPALAVLPLFNTNNVMEMAGQEYGTMFSSDKGLEVRFKLVKPLKKARLRYITTGHGGWENGDEFVPKKNSILLDGKEAFSFVPWRTDCGSYRLGNPASGNFENGLSSSDYSRSNWCPGAVTPPLWIDLGDLLPGQHIIQVKIPLGLPEGGSFSAWNVSGVLIGEQN